MVRETTANRNVAAMVLTEGKETTEQDRMSSGYHSQPQKTPVTLYEGNHVRQLISTNN